MRTITNDTSGLLTQRLFNFAISSVKFDTKFTGIIKVNLNDFCIFHEINNTNLYEKVIHKKKEMTIIEKEIDNITSFKFWLQDENKEEYSFINLFERGTWFKNQGILEFKVVQDLIKKYYIDLKKDYVNIYLPYTKTVTSKYSLRLYEYLRSFLYMNAKTKNTPNFSHEWENNLSILTIDEETSDFSQDKINITINVCSITYNGLEYLNFIRTSCFKWTPIFISSISLILSIITIA